MSLASRAPKPVRALLGPAVERVLYQDRLYDETGEPPRLGTFQRINLRLNQALIEDGRTPPWVWSREQCARFWRASGDGTIGNRPQDYATKDPAIVDVLDRFWRPEISPEASILEIGCNAGTNLNRLRELGYQRLAGIEINEAALQELRVSYRELAAEVELHLGDAETVLRELEDDSVDVIFAMAVLLHIHPSSNSVFREMVRVARRYVCTIEAETALAAYVFPRDYRRVFSRLGCSQVRDTQLTRSSHPEVGEGYFGYVARLAQVPG